MRKIGRNAQKLQEIMFSNVADSIRKNILNKKK
jgi:hypothetical protein